MTKKLNLLRPLDVEAALAGAPVCYPHDDETRVEILSRADSIGAIAYLVNGRNYLANTLAFRMVPLGWVDDRPVYKGDVLYSTFFASDGRLNSEGRFEVVGVEKGQFFPEDRFWKTQPSSCSWDAPEAKPSKAALPPPPAVVKFLATVTTDGFLRWVEDCSVAHRNAVVGKLRRVPSEDKFIEVQP